MLTDMQEPYQTNIQKVIDSVGTVGQGTKLIPARWKVKINIGCSPETKEMDSKCELKRSVKAHTKNTANDDGTGGLVHKRDSTINIQICNKYFESNTLAERIKASKDDGDYSWKYDLRNYSNRGYILLHELFHGDRATYEENGNRHIADMKFHGYEYIPSTEDRLYRKRYVEVEAYGPLGTKILARTNKATIGYYISRNADNFAQYALAKYVQKVLNGYPWLPIAMAEAIGDIDSKAMILTNGTDWGIAEQNVEANKNGAPDAADGNSTMINIDSFQFPASAEVDDNGEEDLEILDDLKWVTDDQYPEDYKKQRNTVISMVRAAQSTSVPVPPAPTTAPPPPPPVLACHGTGSNKYLGQPTLAADVVDFCNQAVKQGSQDPGSGSIVRVFHMGTLDEVSIAVDYAPGHPSPFANVDDCTKSLQSIADGCDGNNPANPLNYKRGGTFTVNEATWHIDPRSERQALPNAPGGGCDIQNKVVLDEFWIWGHGYATNDFGQDKGGLMQQIKDCGLLKKWSFTYGSGSDGREWSAHGTLPIWTSACIQRAIKSAGGPRVGCSGNG